MATVFMVVSQAPLDLSVSVELSISTFYELLDLEYVLLWEHSLDNDLFMVLTSFLVQGVY